MGVSPKLRSAGTRGRCRPAPHSLFGQPPGGAPNARGAGAVLDRCDGLTRSPATPRNAIPLGRGDRHQGAARLQIIRAGFPEEGSLD